MKENRNIVKKLPTTELQIKNLPLMRVILQPNFLVIFSQDININTYHWPKTYCYCDGASVVILLHWAKALYFNVIKSNHSICQVQFVNMAI